MSIYETIITQRNENRSVVGKLLNTLIGEIQRSDKNFKGGEDYTPSDEIVVRTIKKFIESANIVIANSTSVEQKNVAQAEIDLLSFFLPKQLSEQNLEEIAKEETFTLPTYMKHLKEHFTGRYDGKLASEVWKRVRG